MIMRMRDVIKNDYRTIYHLYKDAVSALSSATERIVNLKNIREHINFSSSIDACCAVPTNFFDKMFYNVGVLRYSIPWLYAEIITEVTGENPPLMKYLFKKINIDDFAIVNVDGSHHYTYGERWLTFNEIEGIVNLFKQDKSTRRAVLITHSPWDPNSGKWYVPCTMYHQFLCRDNMMHVILNMRSWDFNRGFKYDVFLALFLQAYVAAFVNDFDGPCKPGRLYVNAGSFHVYLDDNVRLEPVLPIEDEFTYPFTIDNPHTLREELRKLYFALVLNKTFNDVQVENTIVTRMYDMLSTFISRDAK